MSPIKGLTSTFESPSTRAKFGGADLQICRTCVFQSWGR